MIAYRTNLVVIVSKAFRTFHDQCPVHIRVFAVFTGTFGVKSGGRIMVTTFYLLNPETSTTFHSKRPCEHCENSNVYGTLIMKCPKCLWHDYYKICPICDHKIPEGRHYMKEGILRCHDCGAVTHKNAKTLETNFYSPSTEENEDEA